MTDKKPGQDPVFRARLLAGEPAPIAKVKAAIEAAGSLEKAAPVLGVSLRTLSRWVARLAIPLELTGRPAANRVGALKQWKLQRRKKEPRTL